MGYLDELFKKQWATSENIELGANLDSINAAASVLGNDFNGLSNVSLRNIFNNQLESAFGFDYTINYIDSWCKYWTGRYTITSNSKNSQETPQNTQKLTNFQIGVKDQTDKKEEQTENWELVLAVKNAIYYLFKWGVVGFSQNKEGLFFAGSVLEQKWNDNGEITGGIVYPVHKTNILQKSQDVEIKAKDENDVKNYVNNEGVFAKLERDGIGHFVKLLKFIQIDIYLERLLVINGSCCVGKWGLEVRNPSTIADELKQFLTPGSNFFVRLLDRQNSQGVGGNDFIAPKNVGNVDNVNSLVIVYKQWLEHYYALFGRACVNSKQDPLSSDANLGISSSKNIASNYDEKVQKLVEDINKKYKLSLTLEIDKNFEKEEESREKLESKDRFDTEVNSDQGEILKNAS